MVLHELLERPLGKARPSSGVRKLGAFFASCECAIAIPEYGKPVQFEIATWVKLDSRTGVAKVAGVPAHRDEGRGRGGTSVAKQAPLV